MSSPIRKSTLSILQLSLPTVQFKLPQKRADLAGFRRNLVKGGCAVLVYERNRQGEFFVTTSRLPINV